MSHNALFSFGFARLPSACLLVMVALVAMLTACVKSAYDPERSRTRLELAQTRLAAGELDAAETEATQAIRYDASNSDAYMVRGLTYFHRAQQATNLFEVQSCMRGDAAGALRDEQESYLQRAAKEFAKAVELDPKNAEAWSTRGIVANLQSDPELAKTFLVEALRNPSRLISPALTRAHLGWSYYLNKEFSLAKKELLQAVQQIPNMCVANYRLGRVHFDEQEFAEANERFISVIETKECAKLHEAYLYLMQSQRQQGLIADAAITRDACTAMAPKSCIALQCKQEGADLGEAPPPAFEPEGESP